MIFLSDRVSDFYLDFAISAKQLYDKAKIDGETHFNHESGQSNPVMYVISYMYSVRAVVRETVVMNYV